MKLNYINGTHFYNMMVSASNKLESKKEYVNSLNVFPVPDGDTGTNMYMTFSASVKEIEGMDKSNIGLVAERMAKGALMGARGNSGVILSQILRGIAKGLKGKSKAYAKDLAYAFEEGAKTAYKAVMKPTEGTILTIIKAAGEGANNSFKSDVKGLLEDVSEYSKKVLDLTMDMLPVLKKAKVVDAGGMGLCILIDGMIDGLNENFKPSLQDSNISSQNHVIADANEEIRFGYCTEFLILNTRDSNVDDFRNKLEEIGDSIIVVEDDNIIKVHVHTNDPGHVLSLGLKSGDLSKIKIENMREQHTNLLVNISEEASVTGLDEIIETQRKRYGFVAVSQGEGIKNVFKDINVDYIVEGGQTMNPSIQDIVDSIGKVNAETIFVLPNNKNIMMSAEQSKNFSDKNIIVIPTKNINQGIVALTAFDEEQDEIVNVREMINAISKVKTAEVTYAVKDSEFDGKQINKGDILGMIDGKISVVGNNIYEVCFNLIDMVVNEDSELITVFYGRECDDMDKIEKLKEKINSSFKNLDVTFIDGKQSLYYFIVGIE